MVLIDEIDALIGDTLISVLRQTRGQPWLVNALADEACFRSRTGRDRMRAVQADDIREARERLILQRETHLDQLADKLREARVRRVVEPLLSGGGEPVYSGRDLEYARDQGLVASGAAAAAAGPHGRLGATARRTSGCAAGRRRRRRCCPRERR